MSPEITSILYTGNEALLHGGSILRKYFGERQNVHFAINFLNENPSFLPQFAYEIQLGIDALNKEESCDYTYVPAALHIKHALREKGRYLPPFISILDENRRNTKSAVHVMNNMMIRGEQGNEDDPFIKWHAAKGHKLPPASLAAGLFMDVWGIAAACALSDFDCNILTLEQERNLKDDKIIGSEVIMPTIEQVMGMKLMAEGIYQSVVINAIQPWLQRRYGFSELYLKMVQEKFGITLHERALQE